MASLVSISDELKRAKVYEAFRRFDKAVEVYRQLIEQYPCDFRAHFNCGRLLASHDSTLEEALSMFKTVLTLDETVIEAYGAASALLIKLNRPAEAAEHCEAGLSMNGQDQNCMYNLNIALRQMGEIEAAIVRCWDMLVHSYDVETCPQLLVRHFTVPSPHPSKHITAVCVKWGDKYGPEYVNNLHRAIQRHSSDARISRLVCFTDDSAGIDRDVKCLPFDPSTQAWKGWWLKAQVFASSEHLQGWVLYIDLDTVVCGSLDFVSDLTKSTETSTRSVPTGSSCEPSGTRYSAQESVPMEDISRIYVLGAETFQNEARKVGMNSSLLLWHTGNTTLHTVYSFLRHHYAPLTKVIYKFDHYLEMMLHKHLHRLLVETTQVGGGIGRAEGTGAVPLSILDFAGMMNDSSTNSIPTSRLCDESASAHTKSTPVCCYFQDYCAGRIVDYFEYIAPHYVSAVVAAAPSIICFPLKPKPHQLQDSAFIRQHWLGEAEVLVSAEAVD